MIQITIDNIFTKVENLPNEIEREIYTKLSYEIREFGTDVVYEKHLFSLKTKKTYTGLLHYIIDILKAWEVDYQINDLRNKPSQNANYEIYKDFTLRDYQQKIVDECKDREIIRAATGAGKTVIMAGLIAKFKVRPVSIFADKLSLCTQLQSEIGKFLNEEVGLVGGGVNNKKDITVYSVQSATENDVVNSNLVMFDECFPEDVLVATKDGNKTIKEIVDNKLELEIPTYNIDTKKIEYKKIINWGKKKNKEKLYKIKVQDENGKIHELICTENHKIFADNKYIKVKDLIINQNVIID